MSVILTPWLGLRALRVQRPRDRHRVVPQNVEVGRRWTAQTGQCARIARAADNGTRLVGEPLQEVGVRDVLDEDGPNTLFPNLPDQTNDILRGCLRFGTEPLRCEEGQPVVATEILERVM